MRVFVSYSREDGTKSATSLRDELSSAGLAVWRDIEAMVAPDDWRQQLRTALREVDAVLLLLTPGSVASPNVTLEWEIALALQKPVIPVLCAACEIPESLVAAQYRDLSQPPIYAREMIALIGDLKGIKEAARKKVLDEVSALREDYSLSRFHQAIEKLQRWLNAQVYETKIIAAVVWLLKQMSVDSRPDRPARALINEVIEGTYVQPNWDVYSLFLEKRAVFEYILAELSKEIKEESPDDDVPIVLAVMNGAEAQELVQGSAFEGYPEDLRGDFAELHMMLVANGVGEWIRAYQPTPEDWRPFAAEGGEVGISQIVEGALRFLDGGQQAIRPCFIDIRTLDKNRPLLMKLRNEGCIVIVDSISMRHPSIQRAFQQSLLDAYPKTSVVNIAPIQSAFELVRKMRIFLRLQVSDLEFDKRRRDRFEDYSGCREIHEREEFEKWLSDRVGRTLVSGTEVGIRPHMFELTGRRR